MQEERGAQPVLSFYQYYLTGCYYMDDHTGELEEEPTETTVTRELIYENPIKDSTSDQIKE